LNKTDLYDKMNTHEEIFIQ